MSTDQTAWTPDLLEAPHSAPDKARRVRWMFNSIAPRYELINSVFSVGRDAAWRKRAVQLAAAGSGDEVLDVACGTGDFAREFLSAGVANVVGCDFAHEMLIRAARRRRACGAAAWCEADALRLPFGAGRFTIVSCAFGIRNFEDLDAGLAEMRRVLRSGGRAVILEFTRPAHRLVRCLYELYANRLMPAIATVISRDRLGAYRYLPCSVVSFPDAGRTCARLRRVGFTRVTATPLTWGIVTVYVAFSD